MGRSSAYEITLNYYIFSSYMVTSLGYYTKFWACLMTLLQNMISVFGNNTSCGLVDSYRYFRRNFTV